jgi:hypothetical protein
MKQTQAKYVVVRRISKLLFSVCRRRRRLTNAEPIELSLVPAAANTGNTLRRCLMHRRPNAISTSSSTVNDSSSSIN